MLSPQPSAEETTKSIPLNFSNCYKQNSRSKICFNNLKFLSGKTKINILYFSRFVKPCRP